MKTNLLLYFSLLFVFSEQGCLAQNDSVGVKLWTKYPGWVLTSGSDTIYGYLMLKNLVNNQVKALYFTNAADEKPAKKYKPKDIKAYKVGPRYYESIKCWPANEANTWHFLLKILDGPISIYRWYYEPESKSKMRVQIDKNDVKNSKIDLSFSEDELSSETYVIKLDNKPESLTKMKFITNFRKNMSKLVAEDKELVKKIMNKEKGYILGDEENIIREFNTWYLKNKVVN